MNQNNRGSVLLKCEDVGLKIGTRQILSGISLELGTGDRVALLGPSGCGKSTLLNLLARLLPVSSGNFHSELQAGDVSIVFQEPSLLPWKNVEDNVRLLQSLCAGAAAPSETSHRVRDVLLRVGLWERRNAFPDELSGGMKMRVALARALLMSPRLLLLDEPFSALDDFTREKLQDDLLDLHTSSELAFVIVTHNMEEAALLAERILVFSPQGTIVGEVRTKDFTPSRPLCRDSKEVADIRTAVRKLWRSSLKEHAHA
jgi:NitT/TauT family transport system ATP-binding protein